MEFSSDDDTEVDGVGLYLVFDASSLDGAERSSKPEDVELTVVLDASRLDGAERSSKPEDAGLRSLRLPWFAVVEGFLLLT